MSKTKKYVKPKKDNDENNKKKIKDVNRNQIKNALNQFILNDSEECEYDDTYDELYE